MKGITFRRIVVCVLVVILIFALFWKVISIEAPNTTRTSHEAAFSVSSGDDA